MVTSAVSMITSRITGFAVVLCAFLSFAAETSQQENLLWEDRNLGKAFFENPDTQAVEKLHAALELSASVMDRVNYGIALMQAGQTDPAMAELQRAQKEDPSIPNTWFTLGIAYKRAGDYDRAMEQFRGMIRLVPHEPAAHYNLAACLRAKGDTTAALPEFLEAERLNPNLAGPHFQLFTLYQRAGDRQAAARERQAFEEA